MFVNPFRKKDIDRRRRSSNVFKQKEDYAKTINKRLKIMTIVICVLFSVIGVRLAQLQLVNNEEYALKLETFTAKKQTFAPSRGSIYDRNGTVLAESKKSSTIYYYPAKNISEKEEWDLAEKFVNEIGVSLTKKNDSGVEVSAITDRELKDMDYAYHVTYLRDVKDNYNSLLSADELEAANNGDLSNAEVYNLKISRMEVPKVDDHHKKIYLTKMLMDQTPENEYKTILEGATTEQVAYLGEHNSQFPGFKYMNDWVRSYYDNNNSIVKSILGDISSQTQGLPEEKMEYYMGLGYAMNQRVGISGIEKQYEDYLSGTKRSYNITYDENGLAVLNDENEGKNGYDLTLSLDVDLQKKVDEVLNKTMSTHSGGKYKYFDSLYFVAINPQTGEILAMDSIYRKEDGTIYSVPTGTYLDANRAGSVVKMATLYMGLDQGVISPGTVLNDQPMQLKGTQVFKSYTTHGLIDDINAIAVSSNVYMAQIAIKLAGGEFVENGQALYYEDGTFEKMRSYYNMFGLGVQTGIDLPNEGVGSIGGTEEHGKIIPLAIGQYDTYTTMQLAQYVSTIANGGKRVQPHLLKKVTEVNSNRETVIYEHQTNILSTLLGNNVKEYLGRAQKGMRGCVRGTGSKSAFCPSTVDDPNSGTQLAAKTGTAENEIYENGNKLDDTMSSTMVAYGPYIDDDDGSTPEIAFACFAPNVEIVTGTPDPNICAGIIGEVSNYYFSKKK